MIHSRRRYIAGLNLTSLILKKKVVVISYQEKSLLSGPQITDNLDTSTDDDKRGLKQSFMLSYILVVDINLLAPLALVQQTSF